MRNIKTYFIILMGVIIILGSTNIIYAFHSGGVAECEGCHTMHNSFEGAQMTINALPVGTTNAYLLKGQDQSSTCLNCHQHAGDTGPTSYHISTADADMPAGTAPLQLSPGGDFGWLKKTYSWVPRTGAATEYSYGERHGHNIIAADFGYVQDGTQGVAPGGDTNPYPAGALSCISCHDPHGKYRITSSGVQSTTGKPIKSSGSYGAEPDANFAIGVYRLLGGKNYQPKSLSGTYAFAYDAPYVVAPTNYNRAESTSDTRVSYGKGASNWCANCHVLMHSFFGGYEHPTDQSLGSTIAAIYNSYRKTGDLSGTLATAYTSLVPFQLDNTYDIPTLRNAVTSTAGAAVSDRVMCLTCHRAHAGGWDSIIRFPLGNEFMTLADGLGAPIYPDPTANPAQAMGRATTEFQKALYDRPATKFAAYQRVLCNKCHAKD